MVTRVETQSRELTSYQLLTDIDHGYRTHSRDAHGRVGNRVPIRIEIIVEIIVRYGGVEIVEQLLSPSAPWTSGQREHEDGISLNLQSKT